MESGQATAMRLRTPAVLATAMAAAATPVLLGGPAHAASKAEQAQGQRTDVYVQGDSLTVGAGPRIKQRLGKSVRSVSVDAQVGRFTSTGIKRLAQDPQAKRARVWVIALGTNDGPDARALKRHVRRSLALAGPERDVIWLTVQRPGGYQSVNRMLRQSADNDRLHVIDWAKVTNDHPRLLSGDRVHATAHGYQVRGDMIAEKALELAQRG